MMDYIIVIAIGYILGNIQTAYFLGKIVKKVDIRTMGHGNSGTSNAVESLGWRFGIIVGLIDILKGVLSILLVKWFFNVTFDADGALLLYLNGFSVILGHNFPFFMGFKGGKGTATLVGVLWGLHPIFGLGSMVVVLIFTLLTDYIVVGTMALLLYFLGITLYKDLGLGAMVISLSISLLSIKMHWPNFKRINKGEESRVRNVLRKRSVK